MKDAGMRIRVEPELRERFLNVCREQDLPAAQVLRTFMRDYIQSKSPNEVKAGVKQAKSKKITKAATSKVAA
jgi:antitoxin component of RelBE/YafQ-DinJ toxin-antitoxin module